jgi:hypothetical protein
MDSSFRTDKTQKIQSGKRRGIMRPQAQLIGFAGTGSLFEDLRKQCREWDEWDDDDEIKTTD